MITIYVLILLQRVRDSLKQEYAGVCIQNVGNMPFCLSFRTSDHLRGQKWRTGPHGRQLAPQYVQPCGVRGGIVAGQLNEAISNIMGEELVD